MGWNIRFSQYRNWEKETIKHCRWVVGLGLNIRDIDGRLQH